MTHPSDPATIHPVVIAGGGPAGLTAAIYAARADLHPVVVEGEQPGGQLTITADVENYPGFPEGIQGPELVERMHRQAERFETQFIDGALVGVDLDARPFVLHLESGETLKCRALIVATGASAQLLGLASERALMGMGVSACATCDGFFFRDKDVLVVGGGDTALEEALFLTRFARRVAIVHRRDALRGSRILQKRAREHPRIDFIWDSVVEEVLGVEDQRLRGVRLRNVKTDERTERDCDGLFVAIGHRANTDFLKGQLETDASGMIVTRAPSTATSVPGVFACGDVADPSYRQAVTAAGSGCRAALDVERFLEQ